MDKLINTDNFQAAIAEVYRFKHGISYHMSGMIFEQCVRTLPVDMGYVEKMINLLVREGGVYMIAHSIYIHLREGSVMLPPCIRKEEDSGSPGASIIPYED